MILAAGQAIKRLSISQVADNIKSKELQWVSTEECFPKF